MDAIGYVRKSTRDQSNYSLEYQENSIRDYCKRNQIELGGLYIDDGESSYTFDRPDYMALEAFIKLHKKRVKYLIILDHDRFSRNLPEALMKIEQLEKKYGLKVVATNESLDIDTSDPSVFMLRAFKYLIANQELFTIRRRAKMGIRQANESGRFVNRAPFGYINAKEPDGKKSILLIHETQAYVIRKIFRDYLSGVPAYLIHKSVKKMGFPLSGNEAIVRVLKNSLYAGLIKINGTEKEPERLIKGLHKPIIPEEQYWRAQELLDDKRFQKPQPKKEFPLRGILRSPCCGGTMTAGFSKGKKKYYLYYRCNAHSNLNISGDLLHRKFNKLINYLRLKQEQVDEITSYITGGVKEALSLRGKEVEIKKEQLASAEKKLASLEDKLLEDIIGSETYKRGFKKFSIEISRLKSEIADLSEDLLEKTREQIALIPELLRLPAIFELATLNQQHSILNRVFKDGLTFKDGMFRTRSLNRSFLHNYLELNKNGLLFLEQPIEDLSKIPFCGPDGTRTRDLRRDRAAF
jgi:site-specific DNA recombinase